MLSSNLLIVIYCDKVYRVPGIGTAVFQTFWGMMGTDNILWENTDVWTVADVSGCLAQI